MEREIEIDRPDAHKFPLTSVPPVAEADIFSDLRVRYPGPVDSLLLLAKPDPGMEAPWFHEEKAYP